MDGTRGWSAPPPSDNHLVRSFEPETCYKSVSMTLSDQLQEAIADRGEKIREFKREVDNARNDLERKIRGKSKSEQDDERNKLERALKSKAKLQFGLDSIDF